MLTISLEQLQFHSPIGFYKEERILGNEFSVDIDIQIEEGKSSISQLTETIDYAQVYDLIKKEMAKEERLIETVAQNCIQNIKKQWESIKGIEIIIRKLHPPLQGEVGCAKVTLSKTF